MNKWLNGKLDEKRRTGQGFTLIELIVVVTILGILAAIVVYAVGDLTGSANKASAGTTTSEITQAEQAYCQQNGTYGTVQDLVNAGLLTNPNPNLTIYVNTIPANAQLYAACGTSTAVGATSGSVFDVFPQTITQPDGTLAVIPAPPANVVTVDNAGPPAEDVAALGVAPYGGTEYGYTGDQAGVYGTYGISPLVNTTNYVNLGPTNSPNFQAVAAAKPGLIVGDQGNETGTDSTAQLEQIAPVISVNENATPTSPVLPGATVSTVPTGDPGNLPWFGNLVMLGQVLNRQAQAAAFITAFENAAATAQAALAGKSVSYIEPIGTGSLSNVYVEGPTNSQYTKFLTYLGINIASCPAALSGCDSNGDSSSSGNGLTIQEATTAGYITGTELMVVAYSDAVLALDATAIAAGGVLNGLTQIAAGNVWGPTEDPGFGPVASATPGTGTGMGSVTVTLPYPLCSYASITGSVVGTTTACPAGYTGTTLTNGIFPEGPISELAAIPYISADL